ncbi:MAG: YbaK/EbsC family protein [Bacteroidota bacterium]
MLEKILHFLDEQQITYRSLSHEPTLTSEESARVRGEALEIGGKALLLKVNKEFHLFVLSAACKLNSSAIKTYFSVKKLRFATSAELMDQTGLVPGSVPPFGRPIMNYSLYVDESIVQNERIAFNAGSLTHSVIMSVEDYLRLAQPTVFPFSSPT